MGRLFEKPRTRAIRVEGVEGGGYKERTERIRETFKKWN